MAEHLAPPGKADQIIVLENSPVRLQFTTGFEAKDKVLMC
jgi:hypothetical protein